MNFRDHTGQGFDPLQAGGELSGFRYAFISRDHMKYVPARPGVSLGSENKESVRKLMLLGGQAREWWKCLKVALANFCQRNFIS
jgi:hypothetical protein